MKIFGEDGQKPEAPDPGQDQGQDRMCPTLSQLMPVQSSVTGEIEMALQVTPCPGPMCRRWLAEDNDCSDVVQARAIREIEKRFGG